MSKKRITIAMSMAFSDAGAATRGIEIAKGIKKFAPRDFEPKVIFISHGSTFEQRAIDLGFEVYRAQPTMPGIGVVHDCKMTLANLIGEKELAKELIKGEIKAYEDIKPDVVVFEFWPIASLACRMIQRKILTVCFVPLPLTTEKFLDILPDIPEQVPFFSIFPFRARKLFLHYLPRAIQRRLGPLRQPNIRQAAYELGWSGEPLINFFNMLKADLTLVNDLPDFYPPHIFSKNIVCTGPLWSQPLKNEILDPAIKEILTARNNRVKIFCTLGSSGSKEQLLEIVKTFTYGEGLHWDAIILSPKAVCPIEDARATLGKRDGVYLTDAFIPAKMVNESVNLVICHGGQGTVQTALQSGTPIVGVATQAEQFINLYHIEYQGAGIRIPSAQWNAKNIQKAVQTIIFEKRFKEAAVRLKNKMDLLDGEKSSAEAIWKKIEETKDVPLIVEPKVGQNWGEMERVG